MAAPTLPPPSVPAPSPAPSSTPVLKLVSHGEIVSTMRPLRFPCIRAANKATKQEKHNEPPSSRRKKVEAQQKGGNPADFLVPRGGRICDRIKYIFSQYLFNFAF